MDNPSDTAKIAETIRDGTYFEEARGWYRAVYIGPIAERVFFLIISLLAGFVGIISVFAVLEIRPLTSRPGLLISNPRLDDTMLELLPLKAKGTDMNRSLQQFFVQNYVQFYEGYAADRYTANFGFVQQHSDAETFSQYATIYGNTNPQSPAAILGSEGKRVATVESIAIDNSVTPLTATVKFTTELVGLPTANKTRWTASLKFYYSDLAVTEAVDAATGKKIVSTQDPQFQVVSYAVTQTP